MKILITGSNGFIGSNLTNHLKQAYTVIGQGRIGTNVSNNIDFFEVDISGKSQWNSCLSGVNTIVHLAAVAHNNSIDLDLIHEVNVKGTLNLAQQAVDNGVKRFVFISSIGVLGNRTYGKPFDELSITAPHSEYAASKLQAENELLKIAHKTGLEVVIIRPVLVYGAGAPGNFGKLVRLVQKMPFLPFALCKNKRSFVSVDNLVDFISTCIDHPKAKNEIFCISDMDDVSIYELTNRIAKGLSTSLLQLPIPIFMFKLAGVLTGKSEMIDQLIGDLQVDSHKAKELLNWTPSVSMADTFNQLTKTNKI